MRETAKIEEVPLVILPPVTWRQKLVEWSTYAFRASMLVFVLTSITWMVKDYGSKKYLFRDLEVQQKVDDWRWWFVDKDRGRIYVTVCQDYDPPQFSKGQVLTYAVFIDEGKCWSLNPNKHAGYFILRDNKGVPLERAN